VTDQGESRTTTIPGDDSNLSRGRVSSWSSGLSGFADLLRRARAESRLVLRRAAHARHPRIRGRLSLKPGAAAPLHERRDARYEHYVVAAAIAVAAALAALLALVSGARFTNVPGAGGGHRAEWGGTLERQSRPAPVTTRNQTSPTTAAETEPPTLPPSDPVAIPGTTAPAHVPGWPFSNTRDPVQLSSGSSPPLSGSPGPPAPTAPPDVPGPPGDPPAPPAPTAPPDVPGPPGDPPAPPAPTAPPDVSGPPDLPGPLDGLNPF